MHVFKEDGTYFSEKVHADCITDLSEVSEGVASISKSPFILILEPKKF